MSLSGELLRKYEDYLLYDEEGEENGLKEDAPEEAKEAYDEYLRLVRVRTPGELKMKDTWFQIIKSYAIFKAHVLAGITEDAPTEVKKAYKKLKHSGIRLSESGATVRC